jgi:hypothetical protein
MAYVVSRRRHLSPGDWADIRGDCSVPEQKQGQGQDVSGGYSGVPGTTPAYPGTALSVPGTSQSMEIDYVSVEVMEIDQLVFTAREVPSWA